MSDPGATSLPCVSKSCGRILKSKQNGVAFPLHPETPEEGMTLEQLFAGRNYDIRKVEVTIEAGGR